MIKIASSALRIGAFNGKSTMGLALAIALLSWWVCAAMARTKCAWISEENLFKNAKGLPFYFYSVPKFVSVIVNRLRSRYLSAWEIFVRRLSAIFFDLPLSGHIATNGFGLGEGGDFHHKC